jgi:Kef-type K+ transport system membrane component KefB
VDHAVALPLSLLIVFGSAKLLAEIFERLRLPGIVGEIVAGVVVGPALLGWVSHNDLLNALSELGVMFLLFRVGLEIKASELMRVGGVALLVAMLGVAVPFVLGWGIMWLYGARNIESLFVSAAMVATSVGITARVLGERGVLDDVASRIILAAAVIDDILGLTVMAAVSSMARGAVNVLEIALTGILALAFSMAVAKWGTRAMGQALPRISARLRTGEAQFNVALVLLFGLAVGAVYAGVAAIIGAFLAGLALAEWADERVHHLTAGIAEFLVPFFLVGIGLYMDLSIFAKPALVGLSAAIVVAAVISKFVGCGAGALKLGRGVAARVGVGMIPRGEVGMVVAQLGLTLGAIDKPVYSVVVFMSVATTVIAPGLLGLAYRGVKAGTVEERYELG